MGTLLFELKSNDWETRNISNRLDFNEKLDFGVNVRQLAFVSADSVGGRNRVSKVGTPLVATTEEAP